MDGGEDKQPVPEGENTETQQQEESPPTEQQAEAAPADEPDQVAPEVAEQPSDDAKPSEEKPDEAVTDEQKPEGESTEPQAESGEQKADEEQKPADADVKQETQETTDGPPSEETAEQSQDQAEEKTEVEAKPEGTSQDEESKPTEETSKPEAGEASQAEEGKQLEAQTDQPTVATKAEEDKTEDQSAKSDAGEEKPAEDKPAEENSAEATEAGQSNPEGEEEEAKKKKGKKKGKKEEPEIADNFFYNYEQFMSRPIITEQSGLPEDMLTLQRSFGYDCTKRANLHILDEKTLMFAAGNFVLILDLMTKEQTFIRSTSGGGIGAIAVHPNREVFAVAEKGKCPNINIYEWPSLKLYRILRGGTEKSYSFVDFESSEKFPEGKLLASQGGEPDFMLTLWDWKQEKTVLRSKAFSQDVFRATFSTELEGQLTTSGTVHIRFWKMADTFTGLKLQGELGKFGRTEITDIEGYVELPDGKVLSGSEWGNMLLWDGGLIKVEIQRKHKKPCHTGPIQQILLDEGELMSVGIDGYIRVWDFEAIDTADSIDDTGVFELDPMNEMKVGNDVQLKSITKSIDSENEPTIWYAQDANGGIWKLDLSFSHTSTAPEKMFTFHAGKITDCDMSPVSQLAATTGMDNTVRVFDYVQQKQLCDTKFSDAGTTLYWMPEVVDPKGGTVVVGFNDGVVRILGVSNLIEGHNRRKKHHECSLQLLQACKPHNKAVTSVAVDVHGEILATGSSDGTVFFMNIGKTYNPIGFTKVVAPVVQIQFSPARFEKVTLLVFCEGGIVQEIVWPDDGKFDTTKSFEITDLSYRLYKFGSIKSTLRHEEELEIKAKEEEERKKKEEAERKKRIERGLETESEADVTEEEAEPEPEWEPFIPAEPSPILTGFYGDEPGTIWLSMGDFDAGYLYQCKFATETSKETSQLTDIAAAEPIKAISVPDSHDVPICTIRWSKNGQQALFGMQDGQVRIQNLVLPYDISELGPSWCLSVHDNIYGNITGLLQSHDGSMLISTGNDGNFFLFSMMGQEQLEQKIKENKAKLPSAKKLDETNLPDDIVDANAYSIEEAKQKAELDKMMREAEEKKKEVRHHISKMRRMFKQLLEQNESLPIHIRLHKDEFELDRMIKVQLEQHKQEKIDLVRRELAWESEKQRIALEKLRRRFKDVVECDRIVVKAFKTPHEVVSFRASKLSEDFYSEKADFERRRTQLTRESVTRGSTRDLMTGQTKLTDSTGQPLDKNDDATSSKMITTLKGSMGERITKALQKVEEKKNKREERRSQWSELYETKPDDDYEDPGDIAAIKSAKDNIGDYKLKTANDYVVPDHLRMNVDKARGRLLILKDLIHVHKYDFNQRLLALRDKKLGLIEEIKDLTIELEDVNSKLTSDLAKPIPPVPVMHPEEMPEKKMEYTQETLIAFKKEMVAKEAAAAKTTDGGGFGGFGGLGGGTKQPDTARSSPPPNAMAGKQSTTLSIGKTGEESEDIEYDEELSPLEEQIQEAEKVRLMFHQDDLLERILEKTQNFDAELRLLRHDKYKLDIIMKNADLRQVTLFEELVLLKEYEKREDVIAEKVTNRQQDKLDMQGKIVDVTSKLELKKKEIEKLQDKEKTLYAQFQASLGENNKFADYLTKVFKKKIKRSKKKQTEGDDDDEDSDEDSDDDSDWDEDEDDDESEQGGYDLDVCPQGCDQGLYEATCNLREKRLDIEEALVEEKKTNDAFKKELDGFGKKSKVIDNGLKTAQQDLEAFQLEKQQKLNELDVVVSLKLHQIQYMINGVLPQDLSPTLVFDSHGVTQLQHRIKELEQEKYSQKKFMRESKKKHVQLIKDRRTFESKISVMEEDCEGMMVAKFGCVVDLEKVETVTVNRAIEELKEKLRLTEIQCSEETVECDERISEKKVQITDLIRENTKRLTQLTELINNKRGSEGTLDYRQKNLRKKMGDEYSGARKSDIREKQRLIQLVQLQAQEIDALKEEIMLLSRKGGHILPPAQPPLPQSPHIRTISN